MLTNNTRKELAAYMLRKIENGELHEDNYQAFPLSCRVAPYIIGNYAARKWLRTHNIDAFAVINYIADKGGSLDDIVKEPEITINNFIMYLCDELLAELQYSDIAELTHALEHITQ